jgi:hypothetical protein
MNWKECGIPGCGLLRHMLGRTGKNNKKKNQSCDPVLLPRVERGSCRIRNSSRADSNTTTTATATATSTTIRCLCGRHERIVAELIAPHILRLSARWE